MPTRLPPGVLPARDGGGVIFHAPLDARSDRDDQNTWPDGWARRSGSDQGIGFPLHVEVAIRDKPTPFGFQALHVAVNGGGVAVFSPRISIRSGMAYTASAYVNASGLRHNTVSINLSLWSNKSTKPLKTVSSEMVQNTGEWKPLRIERVVADTPDADYAIIGLLVLPGKRQDLSGSVDFCNVQLRESPTVVLSTTAKNHLFSQTTGIDVQCRLAGIPRSLQAITFILEDAYGSELARKNVDLRGDAPLVSLHSGGSGQVGLPGASAPLAESDANMPGGFPQMLGENPDVPIPQENTDFRVQSTVPRTAAQINGAFASWNGLPIMAPGFYRIRVESFPAPPLTGNGTPIAQVAYAPAAPGQERGAYDLLADAKPLTLVVLEPSASPIGGEFGWTLSGFTPAMLDANKPLFESAGLSRVKLPTWMPAGTSEKEWEQLQDLCTWFARRQVGMVGLLDSPPQEVVDQIRFDPPCGATVFSLPTEEWEPTLRTMLAHLSLLIRDWQLTGDDDRTLRDIPNMRGKLADIRKIFNSVGYDVGLGFAWDWSVVIPPSLRDDLPENEAELANAPVVPPPVEAAIAPSLEQLPPLPSRLPNTGEFLSLTTDDPPTPEELAYQLRITEGTNIKRYVSLVPLARNDYLPQDRILDLVRRMLVAKINRADAMFLAQPFDDETGLFHADGTPTELFLPWRTTSLMLCNRRYAGGIRMPGGSTNVIFESPDGRGLMVVWNEKATLQQPVEEALYLGRDVERIDSEGRRTAVPRRGRMQVLGVGPVPVFVSGIDMDVTRFRQRFQIANTTIPSYVNRRNPNSWTFENATDRPVAAEVTLVPPDAKAWTVTPARQIAQADAGAKATRDFTITLSPEATSGTYPFRADVRTEGNDPKEFSIYDEISVGTDDVAMEFMTRLTRQGVLEIYQTFSNNSGSEVSYACELTVANAPNLRVMKHAVPRLPFGQNVHVYRIPAPDGTKIYEGRNTIIVNANPYGDSPGQPLRYRFPARQ